MTAYYNEHDPKAAAWLREIIADGLIAPGVVDTRSIVDVRATELLGYTQCHFFAGIGGWSYALRLAGWPDDRPVWTGSCPCQPFSAAGSGRGVEDERHLWPAFFALIDAARPPVVFGEQVASAEVVGAQGEGFDLPSELSQAAPGAGSGAPCEVEGEEEGPPLRLVGAHSRDPGADRQRGVRSHGAAIVPRWRTHLGLSLAGSDCPFCGVRLQQHPGGLPCDEWGDGRLGRAESSGDGARRTREEARTVQRLVDAIGRRSAEAAGGAWLDLVQADLESAGYSFGASVLPAAGAGAPHIRQRLWWVADGSGGGRGVERDAALEGRGGHTDRGSEPLGLADAATVGHDGRGPGVPLDEDRPLESQRQGAPRRLGDRLLEGLEGHAGDERNRDQPGRVGAGAAGSTAEAGRADGVADAECPGVRGEECRGTGGAESEVRGEVWEQRVRADVGASRRQPWADVAWLPCRDGTYRPTQPGLFPLAHGVSGRVGLLRGAGNAIVPEVAATFIEAYLDTLRVPEMR